MSIPLYIRDTMDKICEVSNDIEFDVGTIFTQQDKTSNKLNKYVVVELQYENGIKTAGIVKYINPDLNKADIFLTTNNVECTIDEDTIICPICGYSHYGEDYSYLQIEKDNKFICDRCGSILCVTPQRKITYTSTCAVKTDVINVSV